MQRLSQGHAVPDIPDTIDSAIHKCEIVVEEVAAYRRTVSAPGVCPGRIESPSYPLRTADYKLGTLTNNSPAAFVNDGSAGRLRRAGPSSTFPLGSKVEPWQ